MTQGYGVAAVAHIDLSDLGVGDGVTLNTITIRGNNEQPDYCVIAATHNESPNPPPHSCSWAPDWPALCRLEQVRPLQTTHPQALRHTAGGFSHSHRLRIA